MSTPLPPKTGWPAGLLQDDCKGLSKALSNTPNARQEARDAALPPQPSEPAPPDTTEIARLRAALVYVAHSGHATPRHMLPEGVTLYGADGVSVGLNGWTVLAGRTPCHPAAPTAPEVAQPSAPPKPLDDPRLQELFSDAITGAMTFGHRNTNPPPAGHWLQRHWDNGRRAAESHGAPRPSEPIEAQAERIGETGAPHSVAERMLFRAYLKGHCWEDGRWDERKSEYSDMDTRVKYAVWRARGALTVPPKPEAAWISRADWSCHHSGTRVPIHEVMEIVESYGPWGTDINGSLQVQIILADEVKTLRESLRVAMQDALPPPTVDAPAASPRSEPQAAEVLVWRLAADRPDCDTTVLCWGVEGFFCGYWDVDGWIGCESGGSVAVTHWAEPQGPQ